MTVQSSVLFRFASEEKFADIDSNQVQKHVSTDMFGLCG